MSKYSVSWFSKDSVTGGSEIIWDTFKKHLGFDHIDYDRAVKTLGIPFDYIKLGFPEIEGSMAIEEYMDRLEQVEQPEVIVKNSMQMPFYKAKAHTICLVQDLHKYAADGLGALGFYDTFAVNRVSKVFHDFQVKSMLNSDKIVFVSDFAKSKFGSQGEVIPNFVDTEIFKPISEKTELRKKYGIPLDKPIGLWVGRFHPQKGWHIMAQLIKEHKNITWLVMFMDAMASKTPFAKNCIFLKPCEHEKMPEIYNLADFVILPSFCESFGLVSLEANACGVPVIHSNTGWLWNKKNYNGGIIVNEWTYEAYKDAVAKLLKDLTVFEPRSEVKDYGLEEWKKKWQALLGKC